MEMHLLADACLPFALAKSRRETQDTLVTLKSPKVWLLLQFITLSQTAAREPASSGRGLLAWWALVTSTATIPSTDEDGSEGGGVLGKMWN